MSRLVRLLASLVLKNDRKEYYLFLCDAHTLSQMERYGWQVNHRGYVYKDQIAQFRKLVDGGKREYHIRVYSDGVVTGHFSFTPEYSFLRHLFAIGSRKLTDVETDQILQQLTES